MKKYIFRLAPVLKLRRLKEENARMELGKLIEKLNLIENQISHDRSQIENYFKIQEMALKTGVRGDQIQSFPKLIAAKEKNIELLIRDQKLQHQEIDKKKNELATLRGELKIIENLQEKDYADYRKQLNKEIDQKVEEQTQNWLSHINRKV